MRNKQIRRLEYGKKMMAELVIPAFEKTNIPAKMVVDKLKECSKYIYTCDCVKCHTKHFAGFNRCNNRWCIPCQHLKLLKYLAKFYPFIEAWINEGKYINMVTFTIKDMEFGKLKESIAGINKAFRSMYNTPKQRKEWQERFPGGIRALEVKIGKNSGIWHTHQHSLIFKETYSKDFNYLKETWKKETKKVFGIEGSVHIQGIKKSTMLGATLEVMKYIVKPELSLYQTKPLEEAFYSLRHVRKINTWGICRKIAKEAENEFNNYTEEKLFKFVCQVCGCNEAELKIMLYEELEKKNILILDMEE